MLLIQITVANHMKILINSLDFKQMLHALRTTEQRFHLLNQGKNRKMWMIKFK